LSAARARTISVILMDINMPRVNGDAACAALRASGCTLPILAVSGNVETAEYWRKHGFTGALGKPFTLEQLHAALAVLMRH
jgi:CheY-like chemotaxis protein